VDSSKLYAKRSCLRVDPVPSAEDGRLGVCRHGDTAEVLGGCRRYGGILEIDLCGGAASSMEMFLG
jgi:hypothetical protein